MSRYLLALDQGTTSSRAILFDEDQNIVSVAQKEFTQYYPASGWVEHNPMEIYSSIYGVMMEVITQSGIDVQDIAAIGITNQRETTVVWDKTTGRPIHNAIVWQCRRTAPICDELAARGLTDYIKKTTGLVLDAYFSATKIKWLLDNVEGAREKAARGELLFGTVDTWLIWKLTEGRVHITDYTNASRTMLYDIHNLCWDERLLKELDIPASMLPEVHDSSEVYGTCNIQGVNVPIAGIAGDQQAALFGQCCFRPGDAKNTYGTGCFVLMNTGDKPVFSDRGLITTIGWCVNGETTYALEGSAFNAGSAIKWLRDELKLIANPQEADLLAETVEDAGGAVFVPAFTGLGAPYWDMYARGALLGVTRGTSKAHICRAVLESIAYESYDLVKAMEAGSGTEISELRVDGGASRSRFLMQYQADLLHCAVRQPKCLETTALGSAMLAGLAVGVWESLDELRTVWKLKNAYDPQTATGSEAKALKRWHKAVEKSMGWADGLD